MKMQGIKNLFKEHGIFSGKRVLAATLTMTMLTGMTMYAAASGHIWISQGDVKYQDANGNQTTLFAKEDLEYLDGKIDTLKADTENGKAEIATAINGYGYHKDDNIATNASYNDLASAIKTSQQIPTDRTFTGVKPGETDETSGTISAATAENLSLGTAAWVDGELIVGNGADNNSYYAAGHDSVHANLESKSINFSGTVRTTGDTSYSDSFPETYNGKMFLCMYFTANFYCNSGLNNGGSWSESYRPTVSLDLANRRVKMFTSVEHSETVYISGTATALYY